MSHTDGETLAGETGKPQGSQKGGGLVKRLAPLGVLILGTVAFFGLSKMVIVTGPSIHSVRH